jgi:hypothetical protein
MANGLFIATTGTVAAPVMQGVLTTSMFNTAGAITGFRVCVGTNAGTCAGSIASGTIKVYGLP